MSHFVTYYLLPTAYTLLLSTVYYLLLLLCYCDQLLPLLPLGCCNWLSTPFAFASLNDTCTLDSVHSTLLCIFLHTCATCVSASTAHQRSNTPAQCEQLLHTGRYFGIDELLQVALLIRVHAGKLVQGDSTQGQGHHATA